MYSDERQQFSLAQSGAHLNGVDSQTLHGANSRVQMTDHPSQASLHNSSFAQRGFINEKGQPEKGAIDDIMAGAKHQNQTMSQQMEENDNGRKGDHDFVKAKLKKIQKQVKPASQPEYTKVQDKSKKSTSRQKSMQMIPVNHQLPGVKLDKMAKTIASHVDMAKNYNSAMMRPVNPISAFQYQRFAQRQRSQNEVRSNYENTIMRIWGEEAIYDGKVPTTTKLDKAKKLASTLMNHKTGNDTKFYSDDSGKIQARDVKNRTTSLGLSFIRIAEAGQSDENDETWNTTKLSVSGTTQHPRSPRKAENASALMPKKSFLPFLSGNQPLVRGRSTLHGGIKSSLNDPSESISPKKDRSGGPKLDDIIRERVDDSYDQTLHSNTAGRDREAQGVVLVSGHKTSAGLRGFTDTSLNQDHISDYMEAKHPTSQQVTTSAVASRQQKTVELTVQDSKGNIQMQSSNTDSHTNSPERISKRAPGGTGTAKQTEQMTMADPTGAAQSKEQLTTGIQNSPTKLEDLVGNKTLSADSSEEAPFNLEALMEKNKAHMRKQMMKRTKYQSGADTHLSSAKPRLQARALTIENQELALFANAGVLVPNISAINIIPSDLKKSEPQTRRTEQPGNQSLVNSQEFNHSNASMLIGQKFNAEDSLQSLDAGTRELERSLADQRSKQRSEQNGSQVFRHMHGGLTSSKVTIKAKSLQRAKKRRVAAAEKQHGRTTPFKAYMAKARSKVKTRRGDERESHLGFISEMMASPHTGMYGDDEPIEKLQTMERIEILRSMNRSSQPVFKQYGSIQPQRVPAVALRASQPAFKDYAEQDLFPARELTSNDNVRRLKGRLEAEFIKKRNILLAIIRKFDELANDLHPQEFLQLIQLDAFLMDERNNPNRVEPRFMSIDGTSKGDSADSLQMDSRATKLKSTLEEQSGKSKDLENLLGDSKNLDADINIVEYESKQESKRQSMRKGSMVVANKTGANSGFVSFSKRSQLVSQQDGYDHTNVNLESSRRFQFSSQKDERDTLQKSDHTGDVYGSIFGQSPVRIENSNNYQNSTRSIMGDPRSRTIVKIDLAKEAHQVDGGTDQSGTYEVNLGTQPLVTRSQEFNLTHVETKEREFEVGDQIVESSAENEASRPNLAVAVQKPAELIPLMPPQIADSIMITDGGEVETSEQVTSRFVDFLQKEDSLTIPEMIHIDQLREIGRLPIKNQYSLELFKNRLRAADRQFPLVKQLHTIDRIQRLAMKVKLSDQKLVPGLQKTYNGDNFPEAKLKGKEEIKHPGFQVNSVCSTTGSALPNFATKNRSRHFERFDLGSYLKGLAEGEQERTHQMRQMIQMKVAEPDYRARNPSHVQVLVPGAITPEQMALQKERTSSLYGEAAGGQPNRLSVHLGVNNRPKTKLSADLTSLQETPDAAGTSKPTTSGAQDLESRLMNRSNTKYINARDNSVSEARTRSMHMNRRPRIQQLPTPQVLESQKSSTVPRGPYINLSPVRNHTITAFPQSTSIDSTRKKSSDMGHDHRRMEILTKRGAAAQDEFESNDKSLSTGGHSFMQKMATDALLRSFHSKNNNSQQSKNNDLPAEMATENTLEAAMKMSVEVEVGEPRKQSPIIITLAGQSFGAKNASDDREKSPLSGNMKLSKKVTRKKDQAKRSHYSDTRRLQDMMYKLGRPAIYARPNVNSQLSIQGKQMKFPRIKGSEEPYNDKQRASGIIEITRESEPATRQILISKGQNEEMVASRTDFSITELGSHPVRQLQSKLHTAEMSANDESKITDEGE